MTSEGDAKRARRAVADALCEFGDATFFSPQQTLCQGHASGEQVLHRGDAHGAAESLERTPSGDVKQA
jgi:hypothetical protein